MESDCRLLQVGCWKRDAGSGMLEVGCWKWDSGSRLLTSEGKGGLTHRRRV